VGDTRSVARFDSPKQTEPHLAERPELESDAFDEDRTAASASRALGQAAQESSRPFASYLSNLRPSTAGLAGC
jgi:hypothetical protein